MYREHCLGIIAPAMRADITVFRRGIMFAVCSIRQPTINVPDQLAVLFDGAEDENPLFGHKFQAWDYVNDDAKCAALWRELETFAERIGAAVRWDQNQVAEAAIIALLRVPGLGIVKAAFVAQLMGFDVACLDARNIKREGRNPRAFRTDGRTPASLSGKVQRYVVETYGRAEEYWNAWCADVAEAYSQTPEEVSALHLSIIPPNYVPF